MSSARRFWCTWPLAVALAFTALAMLPAGEATADVVVLANRTGGRVAFQLQPQNGRAELLSLPAGEVMPYFADGTVELRLSTGGQTASYRLGADSAYFFGRGDRGQIGVEKIGLGDSRSTGEGRALPGSVNAPVATIPVKILVDEEEPSKPFYWQRRLRQRVEAVSAILGRYCRVRLEVVAVGTWDTDDSITDFENSLREFEREVSASPAQLAIGFTSQYTFQPGRVHLAGTHGPLASHILVREAARPISEAQRVELLVHELGHYLGASHSPERTSVMRPVLGNRTGTAQIRFDPVNALVIAMVGEEIRRRDVDRFAELTSGTKNRLRQIYTELAKAFPTDPATEQFKRSVTPRTDVPIVAGTKHVLGAIVRAAEANRHRPATTDGTQPARREGDALTEYYVRQAARAAESLPAAVARSAFLTALGIGLDDSMMLRGLPQTKAFVAAVESPDERRARLAVLGRPTVHGRRDLTSRFAQSAYLAAVLGSQQARTVGMGQELRDAQGERGFSFVDVAAHEAGLLFAGGVINQRFSLPALATSFSVDQYIPPTDSLDGGLNAAQLDARYGSADDERFQTQLQLIRRRILELTPYQARSAASQP